MEVWPLTNGNVDLCVDPELHRNPFILKVIFRTQMGVCPITGLYIPVSFKVMKVISNWILEVGSYIRGVLFSFLNIFLTNTMGGFSLSVVDQNPSRF